jgi:hypothetical protein
LACSNRTKLCSQVALESGGGLAERPQPANLRPNRQLTAAKA